MEHFSATLGRGRPKADGTLVSDADLAVERALLDVLARERPRDAVLSEESGSIGTGSRVWTIDPIDGTQQLNARLLVMAKAPVPGTARPACACTRKTPPASRRP